MSTFLFLDYKCISERRYYELRITSSRKLSKPLSWKNGLIAWHYNKTITITSLLHLWNLTEIKAFKIFLHWVFFFNIVFCTNDSKKLFFSMWSICCLRLYEHIFIVLRQVKKNWFQNSKISFLFVCCLHMEKIACRCNTLNQAWDFRVFSSFSFGHFV